MERVLSERQLSLELPAPLQGLVPQVRSKPGGNKELGTKVVTQAFGRSVSSCVAISYLEIKPLSYIQRFSVGFSGAPEQFKVLERKAL